MLSLQGNSERAFAQRESINSVPKTLFEWNYNAINRPYVVYPSASPAISAGLSLNASTSWSPTTTYSSNGGYISDVNTSGSAITMKMSGYSTDFISNISGLTSNYYKIVFYLKADVPNTSALINNFVFSTPSAVGAGSDTDVYYRVVPVYMNGVRGENSPTLSDISTVRTSGTGSVNLKWASANVVAYDIQRAKVPAGSASPTILPFVATITGNVTSYTDDLNIASTQTDPYPSESMSFAVYPSIALSASGTPIEGMSYYIRAYNHQTHTLEKTATSVEVDGTRFTRVEVLLGSDQAFDSAEFRLSVNGTYINGSIILSDIEMFKINKWNYLNTEYYPLESVFLPNRPGEALLNPYVPSIDKLITIGGLNYPKPVTNIFYNPDAIVDLKLTYPFKQMSPSIFNKFKYYLTDNESATQEVSAWYKDSMSINKVVIKTSTAISDMSSVTGTVTLHTINGSNYSASFAPGAFDSHGILIISFNGYSLVTGTSTPASLSDSGQLINVINDVVGITLTCNTPPNTSRYLASSNGLTSARLHLIEFSPRLEVDLSDLLVSKSITKMIDDSESAVGLPFGYINANVGKAVVNNFPVSQNGFPHTLFDNFSRAATFSDLLRQGVKITSGLISPLQDFTDYIPFFTMYADTWEVNNLDNVTITVFDLMKYSLMAEEAPDYLCYSENIFNTITNILDASGVGDYDYNFLKTILNRRTRTVLGFSCSRVQTLFDVLKNFFVSYQIGAVYDEYGILRFYDLDDYIFNYAGQTFKPVFAITDTDIILDAPTGSINYSANIVKDTYQATIDRKLGKIVVTYRTPTKNFTDDNYKKVSINSPRVQETVTPEAIFTSQGTVTLVRSILYGTVPSTARSFYMPPLRMITDPQASISEQGAGFLNGEMISWKGVEYKFTPINSAGTPLPSVNRVIIDPADKENFMNQITFANSNVYHVQFEPTGNIVGVQRGLMGTKPRNHYFIDDVAKANGNIVRSDSVFKKVFKISTAPSGTATINTSTQNAYGHSSILFQNNVCKFNVLNGGHNHPLVLIPKAMTSAGDKNIPVSGKNFNYFSTIVRTPNFTGKGNLNAKTNLEFGFYFNHPTAPLMVGLRNNYTAHSGDRTFIAINPNSIATAAPKVGAATNQNHSAPLRLTKNVFDGNYHRIGFYISGTRFYIYIDRVPYGPFPITTRGYNFSRTTDWGIYVHNMQGATPRGANSSHTVEVHETYAYNYDLRKNPTWPAIPNHTKYDYHFQQTEFLNELVKINPDPDPSYYIWGKPTIFGVQVFDKTEFDIQKNDPGAALPNTIAVNKNFGYTPDKTPGYKQTLHDANYSRDIVSSTIIATPFRFSMVLVNNSIYGERIYLSKDDGNVGNGVAFTSVFSINAQTFKLNKAVSVEKIINPENSSNSSTLTTDWIQSDDQLNDFLDKVMYMTNTFNVEVNLEIFGNPLVQTGDICQMVYSVKKIGYDPAGKAKPAYFLIKEVSQDYSNGLKTTLRMRPLFDLRNVSLD